MGAMVSIEEDFRLALDRVVFARRVLDLEDLDPWQEAFLRSEDRRLLVNVYRQGGKSSMTAVIALHRALYHPRSLVLILAPALRQALEFFEKVSDCYQRLSGEGLAIPAESDRKLGIKLKNGSRIEALPGSEKTVRGFSKPDLIVVDEAARVDDDLFTAILPMLTVSRRGDRLLMLSTPLGKRGIYWRLWDGSVWGGSEAQGASVGWERVQVPVTDVPRISPAAIEEPRDTLLEWEFQQEYLTEFADNAASVFSLSDLRASLTDEFEPLTFSQEALS
jgi:hypothetical protein